MAKLNKNKYWKKAIQIIPGGNLLYSKRPEMFLPNEWPTYFHKSKNCYVWDLNNRKYIDMIFAVGTNVLGYSNIEINKAVNKAVENGNLTTLNSLEEINLANELLKINKWAGMVKFARSGGEANTISIRIARAYLKKKHNIAACGYHGWHDWFLSSNLRDRSNLNYHISKNIKTAGVPKKLANTTFLFKFNDLKKLEYYLKSKNIGIIKMEVQRNITPEKDFLLKVRKLANKYKAVLIFDECTSGFRETYGGIHQNYGVNPDIIIFGKALGNGHAINAIIGKTKIMKSCNKTFLSSTFWSERVGFSAAIKTLQIMKKKKTWKLIKSKGLYLKSKWRKISKKNNLDIEIFGLDSIPQFKFKKNHNILKTFITREMLKRGYLASNVIYLSVSHTKKIIDNYIKNLDIIFNKISKIKNPKKEINIVEAHKEIKRLN